MSIVEEKRASSITRRKKPARGGRTAESDPYLVLGVDRTATKDQIKKAYYERAKRHHPDAGGDGDTFLPVKLAYETLIDDVKRAFFDTFGVTPGSVEADEIQAACNGLGALFLDVIKNTSPENLKKLNVIECMRQRVESELNKNGQNLKEIERSEKRYAEVAEILAAKLKNADPKKPNVFQQSVQAALDQCAAQRLNVTTSIAVQKRALEILKNSTFDFEKEPEITAFRGMAFVSTTSW